MATEATRLKVFRAVCYFIERHGGEAYPGVRKIAGRARVDKETVAPTLAELEAMGLLRITRPDKGAWVISLTDPGTDRWAEMKRAGSLYGSVQESVQPPVLYRPPVDMEKWTLRSLRTGRADQSARSV